MTPSQIIQVISILLFISSASAYYNIRRTLHKLGYPVSIFVYSGPCWGHYKDLIEKSAPQEKRRLKIRKTLMIISLALAFAGLLLSSVIAKG